MARSGFLLNPFVQFGVIQIEFLLGGWLVSGFRPSGSVVLASLVFATFAVVSFFFGVTGQSSCGCFGQVDINPWFVFTFDVVVLMGLIFLLYRGNVVEGLRPAGIVLTCCLLVNLVLCCFVYAWFGSPSRALAELRGQVVSVHEIPVSFGEGRTGELLSAPVTLHNLSSRPIRIIAGTSDCSCLATNDLPVTIPAGGSTTLSVDVILNGNSGVMSRTITLVTDASEQPLVIVPIWAIITG